MYYILECPPLTNENGEALLEIHNHEEVGSVWDWQDGEALSDEERISISTPIEITFDRFRDYRGPVREYIDVGLPLMSNRMKTALESFGIENIEFFPVILKGRDGDERIPFQAFKLAGLASMADITQSESESDDDNATINVSFKNLVMKNEKLHSLLIFRMLENINAVFVHETLKAHIEKSGIDTLQFIDPKDWVQL